MVGPNSMDLTGSDGKWSLYMFTLGIHDVDVPLHGCPLEADPRQVTNGLQVLLTFS